MLAIILTISLCAGLLLGAAPLPEDLPASDFIAETGDILYSESEADPADEPEKEKDLYPESEDEFQAEDDGKGEDELYGEDEEEYEYPVAALGAYVGIMPLAHSNDVIDLSSFVGDVPWNVPSSTYTNWSVAGNTFTITGNVTIIGNAATSSQLVFNAAGNHITWNANLDSSATGGINLQGGGDLTIAGGTITAAAGIAVNFPSGDIVINGGDITSTTFNGVTGNSVIVNGGTVTAQVNAVTGGSGGVTLNNGTITTYAGLGINGGAGGVIMTGGDVIAHGTGGGTNAINAGAGGITISGGTVTAQGNGLSATGDVTVNNGAIYAVNGAAVSMPGGGSGNVVVNGGEVVSSGWSTINLPNTATGNVTVNGGTVINSSGAPTIQAPNGTITVDPAHPTISWDLATLIAGGPYVEGTTITLDALPNPPGTVIGTWAIQSGDPGLIINGAFFPTPGVDITPVLPPLPPPNVINQGNQGGQGAFVPIDWHWWWLGAPGTFNERSSSSSDRDDRNVSGAQRASTWSAPRQDWWLTLDTASVLMHAATTAGQEFTRSHHSGRGGVRATTWATLGSQRYIHDTVDMSGNVQVRVIIDNPRAMTGDVMVSGHLAGSDVTRVRSFFERWHPGRQVRVIHFDHQGEWSQTVRVAAKVDLTGMSNDNLHFYSYDAQTNVATRIVAPDYSIDGNGFLHFSTPLAGSIVITDGLLE